MAEQTSTVLLVGTGGKCFKFCWMLTMLTCFNQHTIALIFLGSVLPTREAVEQSPCLQLDPAHSVCFLLVP